MAQAVNRSYPGTPGTPLYVGVAAPTAGTVLSTITLENTSASVQGAGFISPMFGLPLVQGQVPAGQAPQFSLLDGTPCPATLWGVTSWPDGSMKFCAAMVRVPAPVPGSGSLVVQVKNGGAMPTASARSTTDLLAADIKTELTGVTNLTGVWTASLNTAIADGTDVVVIGDGAAGKVWRIGGACKQAGTAHGQIHAWHYVAALSNSAGGLLGLRYLGRIAQPWTDVATPARATRTLTAALLTGATTVRALQGIQIGELLGSTITLPQFTDFFTCAADARWDYVQGGGSAVADGTVRIVRDKAGFMKPRLIPAYDMALTPTNGPAVDYYAQAKGACELRAMGSGGPRAEIGIMPAWAARHVLTQSASDERAVRVTGLASGGWRTCLRQSATKEIVPCVSIQPSYTGLGATQPSWRYWGESTSFGVPSIPEGHLWGSEYEPSHRPAATYYPYVLTGEPQYLDLMVEQATQLILAGPPGGTTWKVGAGIAGGSPTSGSWSGDRDPIINGVTYKGAGMLFSGNLYRVAAWGTRDFCQAAAIYPDVCPKGTALRAYLRDVVGSYFEAINAYNSAMPASWRAGGLVSFLPNDAGDTGYESPWALGYLSKSVCHQSMILPDIAGAATFRQHLAKFYSAIHAVADSTCIASYRMSQWKGDGTRMESTADLVFGVAGAITTNAGTGRLTATAFTTITDGDVFAFTDNSGSVGSPNKPFAEATNNTRFYAVNSSGNTFQLAATVGGPPIPVTASVSIGAFFCRLQNATPWYSFEGNPSPSGYCAEIYGALRAHEACGDAVVNSARLAQDTRWAQGGGVFTNNPVNAMAAAYPE